MSTNYTAQAIANTAPKYLPGAINQTVRQRFLLSYLQKAGRFVMNEGGVSCTWNVTSRQPEVHTTRGQRAQFVGSDTKTQLTITHAQLEGTDVLDRNTMMVNKGPTAIVKLTETKLDELVAAVADQISAQVYVNNSSDDSQLTGIGTLMRGEVAANTDRVAVPVSGATYGGKSMVLGNQGGKWDANLGGSRFNTVISTDWPEGRGDVQYDYLTPKMFNYTGDWSDGTDTWALNCEKLLRRAKVSIRALGGAGAAPAVAVFAPEMYNELLDSIQTRERLRVSDYASDLGFGDTLSYDGMVIAFDYDCPSGKGYAINPQEMALYSVHDQLMYTDGPTWDTREQANLFLVGFLGNLRWNPKHFAEFGSYTT